MERARDFLSSSPQSNNPSFLPPSTDLRLDLNISSSDHENSSSSRNQNRPTFFVKVYMEGYRLGRKIDLYTHHNYDGLIDMLCHMFETTIRYPDAAEHDVHNDKNYLLTYEDKEGDWMMVGDVPWDFFLTKVKKLQISRADNCY